MQTQNNGYNIKMSSKFDQSGNGPVFSSRSCPSCLLAGKQPWPGIARISLPEVVTISLFSESHFQKTFLCFFSFSKQMGIYISLSTSTLSYVGNLFTPRSRCSTSFKKRLGVKLRAALSYYVHRPSLGGQEIFPKDGGHLGRETISLSGEHLFVER